jgi:hypothetical protein
MTDQQTSEGVAASDNMNGGVIAEFHGRLAALEKQNVELQERLDRAQNSGTVEPYPGFGAHIVHVMTKHFYHDRPEPNDVSKQGSG